MYNYKQLCLMLNFSDVSAATVALSL